MIYFMRNDAEYYKFKAEIWKTLGFISCTPFGLKFLELLKQGFKPEYILTINSTGSIILLLFGIKLIEHSIEIMEGTYVK